jgi:hypothetical protein
MLFIAAGFQLSFPRVWYRARNRGFFRTAASVASQQPSLLVSCGANDGGYEAGQQVMPGVKVAQEKIVILPAAATRENDKRASFVNKDICRQSH